ncbi:MAG: V-type ATP synthase subunit F [Clostridia bacterium]
MKIVGIFNKKEEEVGFRLSGIDSKYVKTTDNLTKLLNELKQNNNIGILVISKDIYNLLPEEFDKIQKQKLPLLLKLN